VHGWPALYSAAHALLNFGFVGNAAFAAIFLAMPGAPWSVRPRRKFTAATSDLPFRFARPAHAARHIQAYVSMIEVSALANVSAEEQRRLKGVRDAAQRMSQLIDDLLANAVKYTRTRSETRIQVFAIEQDDEMIVGVKDNGGAGQERIRHGRSGSDGRNLRAHRQRRIAGARPPIGRECVAGTW